MYNFHKERVVRSAKKEHVCYLCGQKIENGEQYRIMTGVFDGDFYSLKLHGQCHSMVEAYWAEQECYDEGWDNTMVMDFINQWLREDGYEPPKLKRDAINLWLELYGNR